MKRISRKWKHIWNHNPGLRYMALLTVAALAAALLGWYLAADAMLARLNEENFRVMAAMFGKVKETYPDFRESEWLELIGRQQDGYAYGQEVLSRYGVFRENGLWIGQAAWRGQFLALGGGLLALVCVLIFAGLAVYLWRRQKRIDRLTEYIREVEQGSYQLELERNREDELSALQNELYRVTVLLRESAELSGKQKRALADSVSDISHQLKTPLASVMVLLDNLSESSHMDELTRRKFLAEIVRQLTNVNWLTAALLKLSRLDAGVVEFECGQVSVDELLDDVVGNLEVQAEWKQVQVVREGAPGIVIEGDRRWIGEAVTNLVKNAIEHSAPDGRVVIHTEENAVYTAVAVRDWGEGISEEDQKHIFERFYRSASAGENSTGIGLSLAKEIVERQNGYLTMRSDPEKGTEFLMKFMKSGIK